VTSLGRVRNRFLRLAVTLTGPAGVVEVEFVVDTGFEGELSVPPNLARQIASEPSGLRSLAMADSSVVRRPYHEATIEWNGIQRLTEVLVLDGRPLLGVELLDGCLLQAEMTEGGELLIEPL
jgi:clan AA aspartic protease